MHAAVGAEEKPSRQPPPRRVRRTSASGGGFSTGREKAKRNVKTPTRQGARSAVAETADMKFGETLAAAAVPEWRASYVDYGALKKVIKDVAVRTVC